jgi:hypothetical protein
VLYQGDNGVYCLKLIDVALASDLAMKDKQKAALTLADEESQRLMQASTKRILRLESMRMLNMQ